MRHRPKKPFVIESRLIRSRPVPDDILDLFPDWGNWSKYGQYETEKQARQAIEQLQKNHRGSYVYRMVVINQDGNN